MKTGLRLFFPSIAVLFILSVTGYSHEKGIPHEPAFDADSEQLREAVVTNAVRATELAVVRTTELKRVPSATASVNEYLKEYAKRATTVAYFDEELELSGGYCGRCWPCHLGCMQWDGHFNNCNGAVCWCIGEPPYSGCY